MKSADADDREQREHAAPVVSCRMNPPASGATSGTVPDTRNRRANIRAVSVPEPEMSRTAARAIEIPAAPAIPCSSRSTSRNQIDGATRAQRGGDREERHAGQQGPAPAAGVADRPGEQLPDREPDHRRGQRELRRRRGGRQVARHRRQRGEVQVHRQRPEGRERAQQDVRASPPGRWAGACRALALRSFHGLDRANVLGAASRPRCERLRDNRRVASDRWPPWQS